MKSIFFPFSCLMIALTIASISVAQENESPKTRLYPNIEIAGLYNLNKYDVFKSDNNRKLYTHNYFL